MRKVFIVVLLLLVFSAVLNIDLLSETTHASCGEESRILTLKPWYYGVTEDDGGSCSIKLEGSGIEGIGNTVWKVVLNVVEDLFHVAGYVSAGYIIYGGFTYMTSAGNPERATKGRRIVQYASIGLVIALSSVAIINFIIREALRLS